jgi:hypothetical protein
MHQSFLNKQQNVASKKSYFIRDFLTQVSKRCLKLCLSLVNSLPGQRAPVRRQLQDPLRAWGGRAHQSQDHVDKPANGGRAAGNLYYHDKIINHDKRHCKTHENRTVSKGVFFQSF